jgi:hypothetical protein
MFTSPDYIWVITVAGVFATLSLTCALLYRGAQRARLSRLQATSLAGGAATLLGGWFTLTAVIAHDGGYHTALGHGVPWMPIAVLGYFLTLLALSRLPVVSAAMNAPGMMGRLVRPHTFRVAGIAFLLTMALGGLPALFALPAGLGDIAVGIAAPRIARTLNKGTGRRAAVWFNVLGTTDLVVALTLGAFIGFQPSGAAITQLPLALIPTAEVPLLLVLHVTSLLALRRMAKESAVSLQPLDLPKVLDGAGPGPASDRVVLPGDTNHPSSRSRTDVAAPSPSERLRS